MTTGERAGRREWIGLAVLALPTLLVSMDFTVLYVALPRLAADLGASATQQLWIMDVYGFLVAGLLITMGALGDRIGRRRLLLVGAAGFGAASVLAAFSTSAGMLIATRALLGVAGATLMPSTLALLSTMFRDPGQRASAIGIWAGSIMTGGTLGPIIGGQLLEHYWWGSVFLLGVPVMVVLLVAGPLLLPEYRAPGAGRLEPTSVALSLAAILPVVYGVKELAAGHGDSPAVPVAAILAGLVFGVLFARRQRRLAHPLLDPRLFADRTFTSALVVMLVAGTVLAGYFLLLSQYVQIVLELSPSRAGLWLSPASLVMAVGAAAAPAVARRVRPDVLVPAGLLVSAAGFLVLTQAAASGGLPVAVTSVVVIHLGVAPLFALGTDLIVGSVPPERAGSAASVSETCNELGVALGMATLGTVGTAVYRLRLDTPDQVPEEAAGQAREGIAGAVAAAEPLPSGTSATLLDAAGSAFTTGLHVTAVVGAVVFATLAVVARRTLAAHRTARATVDAPAETVASG
ncbi:MAG TPA: MFS transporter [Thermomonospora sp.]|nr:MFS transporter [Thermomonospora sp.]